MVQESTLTVQEIEAAHLAAFDLGPGYPQLPVPPYVQELYTDDRIEELSLYFAPYWTPAKEALVDAELATAIAGFLSLGRNEYDALRVTFSGSIALDRALTALVNRARLAGAEGLDVITTTPSIDIMRLFLEERPAIAPTFVRSRRGGRIGALDADAIVAAVHDAAAKGASRHQLILLTSPENPTGAVWSRPEIEQILEAAREADATLLMDHTFLLAGVHEDVVPRVWNVAPNGNWIAVWDTGKTFGLNEDKLGFIITGSPELTDAVDAAIAVTQFGVARRQKLFFSELVKRAVYYDHLRVLRETCRTNLAQLIDATASTPLEVMRPEAGSMALVDCSALDVTDEAMRQRWIAAQIGVIAGNVFFHDDWRPRHYVRVALARHPEHFARAVDELVRHLPLSEPGHDEAVVVGALDSQIPGPAHDDPLGSSHVGGREFA